jgi:hypothetical protein
MYFTEDSLFPESQPRLMIAAVPYGPMWMPTRLHSHESRR